MVAQAFEDLAQAMRLLAEARLRAGALLSVDWPEAVGNLEAALSRILDSFHSAYDAMEKEGIRDRVDWYATPQLCTVLALRNARHHNLCSKIRTVFRYHEQTAVPQTARKRYFFVTYPPGEEEAMQMDLYLSVGDLETLLTMPTKASRLRSGTRELIESYLSLETVRGASRKAGFDIAAVFFNVVPLVMNAGVALHPHVRDRIKHVSTESTVFDDMFGRSPYAQMTRPMFSALEFSRPIERT